MIYRYYRMLPDFTFEVYEANMAPVEGVEATVWTRAQVEEAMAAGVVMIPLAM